MQRNKGMISLDDFKNIGLLGGGKINRDGSLSIKPDVGLINDIAIMQRGKGMLKQDDFKTLVIGSKGQYDANDALILRSNGTIKGLQKDMLKDRIKEMRNITQKSDVNSSSSLVPSEMTSHTTSVADIAR